MQAVAAASQSGEWKRTDHQTVQCSWAQRLVGLDACARQAPKQLGNSDQKKLRCSWFLLGLDCNDRVIPGT